MSYNLTEGYSLSSNTSAPGIKSIWINQGGISSVTEDSSSNKITAFTGATDDDAWYEFECALGEGQLAIARTAGSGGREDVATLTYRIGGVSQAKLDSLKEILDSARLAIVTEMRDGSLYYVSRNGMTAQASAFDTGVSGGGAAGIGETITFTSHDAIGITEVDLGSNADLDAITS